MVNNQVTFCDNKLFIHFIHFVYYSSNCTFLLSFFLFLFYQMETAYNMIHVTPTDFETGRCSLAFDPCCDVVFCDLLFPPACLRFNRYWCATFKTIRLENLLQLKNNNGLLGIIFRWQGLLLVLLSSSWSSCDQQSSNHAPGMVFLNSGSCYISVSPLII